MPLDPLNIPLGVFSLEAAEAIADAINEAGSPPAGSSGQLQYNDAGAFGGIAESTYIPGATPLLAVFADQLTFEVASGPSQGNTVEVTPSAVSITATESGSTAQIVSDGDLNISSNSGNVNVGAAGDFSLGGNTALFGAVGRVSFQSSAATPKYNFAALPVFANNAAAIAGGLIAGDLYRTGANPDPVCIVH